MNLIEQYRKAHPEHTVWTPEKGWHDSEELARWEGEGGQSEPTAQTDLKDRPQLDLLAIVQHLNSGGF
jgi:hypothetical protein